VLGKSERLLKADSFMQSTQSGAGLPLRSKTETGLIVGRVLNEQGRYY
jgi:hypothetical protein